MADAAAIKSFLVSLGYSVDQTSQDSFLGAIASATARVGELAAAVEAAGLAVVGFVTDVASHMEKLYWESQRTHTSVENIEAFAYAVSNLGGTAAEANQALESFGSFLRSSPGAMALVNSVTKQNESLKDETQILKDLGVAFAKMPIAQAEAFGHAMHISENMVLVLRGHAQQTQQYENQVHDAYRRIGFDAQDSAKKSALFMDELREVWAAGLEPLIDKIATGMMPALTQDMERFRQLVLDHVSDIERVAKAVTDDIMWIANQLLITGQAVAQFVSDFITWYGKLDAPTQHLIKLIGEVGVALWLFKSNPFVAIIAGLAFLIRDFEAWKRGSAHVINWDYWGPEIQKAIDAFVCVAHWLDGISGGALSFQNVMMGVLGLLGTKWLLGMLGIISPIKGALVGLISLIARAGVGLVSMAGKAVAAGVVGGGRAIGSAASAVGGDTLTVGGLLAGAAPALAWGSVLALGGDSGPMTPEERAFRQGADAASNKYMETSKEWAPWRATRAAIATQLEAAGYSGTDVAGILANIQAESAYNPNATNASGHVGLGQWDATRQAAFQKMFGYSMTDASVDTTRKLHDEVAFMIAELHGQTGDKGAATAGQALPQAKTAGEAALVVAHGFERYGNDPTEDAKRAGIATQLSGIINNIVPPHQDTGHADALHAALAKTHSEIAKHALTQLPAAPLSPAPRVNVQVNAPPVPKSSGKGATITQTITNNIHTTDDPNAIGAAATRASYRANQDLVRQTRVTVL